MRIRVVAANTEEFLNDCATANIGLKNVVKVDCTTVEADLSSKKYRDLPEIRRKSHSEIRIIRKPVRWTNRGKLGFVIGVLIFAVGLILSQSRLWAINITGNDSVPTAKIMRVLDDLGVFPGVRLDDIEPSRVKNLVMLEIDELSFFAINLHGTVANVIVREATPAAEVTSAPADIVAKRDTLVEKIIVTSGLGVAQKNEFLQKGKVLISGTLASAVQGTRTVRADGIVEGRTWYLYEAKLPLTEWTKCVTGRSFTEKSLIFGKRRIKICGNSGNCRPTCDKIMLKGNLGLFGIDLPIEVETITSTEYTVESRAILPDEAAERLSAFLTDEFRTAIEGEILSCEVVCARASDCYIGRMCAECRENISEISELGE